MSRTKGPCTLQPRKKVTTDENGQLKCVKLEPNAEYVICEEVPVPPAGKRESREEIVRWIDGCVFGDLRTVVLGIQERKKRGKPQLLGGCNFLLAGCCCMALEYLGQVYGRGTDGTASVQKYVEKFLAPIDPRYKQFWPILWRSFRNGILHGSWPQRINIRGYPEEKRIAVRAGNSLDGDHFERDSDRLGRNFAISSARLFHDIEHSFHAGFRSWILNDSDEGILERAAPRLLEIKERNAEGKTAFEQIEQIVAERL